MPQCLEIKAKVKNLEEVKLVAASLSSSDGQVIQQRDVFFNVDSGLMTFWTLQSLFWPNLVNIQVLKARYTTALHPFAL